MTNKQELINWMTEKRESLSFENKVQLIWDYWKNKDTIPNLQKDIAIKELQLTNKDNQINVLNNQITKKDDRIFQLNRALKGSALILKNQIAYTIKLEEQLKTEKNDKNTSQEQAQHLQEDIDRLVKERKAIEDNLEELKAEETKNKALRDQEIADLKQKVNTLTAQLNDAIKVDQQIFNLLGQHSSKTNLLERTQEVVQKLKQETLTEDDVSWLHKLNALLGGEISWTRQQMDNLVWPVDNHRILAISNHIPKIPSVLKNKGINQKVIAETLVIVFGNYYTTKTELAKEKGWWDKWFDENKKGNVNESYFVNWNPTNGLYFLSPQGNLGWTKDQTHINQLNFKKFTKEKIYQYYLNK